jgi:hypothetical protein
MLRITKQMDEEVLDDQDDWRRVYLRLNRLIKAYLEIDVSMKKYQWSKKYGYAPI